MNRINIMEVCGTHTMAIARHGLKKLFPPFVSLISGPGCPVCVTPVQNIDQAIELSKRKNLILTTFGDMYYVPGSASNLSKEHAKGADIRIVYSSYDSLDIARDNPDKEVVFLGVGFETTSPTVAATVLAAKKNKIGNFSVLAMFKIIPPALKAILEMKERKIDGFLLPGHVSAIIGSLPYAFIAANYKIPSVISGFEPKDILKSVDMIINQIKTKKPEVQIQYDRVVSPYGNSTALGVINEVFRVADSRWRGIGLMKKSGLAFIKKYEEFDAAHKFRIRIPESFEHKGCLCGKVLLGLKAPKDCRLFAKLCTPANPIGPCMVSTEGTCAAVYKYERN